MSEVRVSVDSFTDAEGRVDPDAVADEIASLATDAGRDRDTFEQPVDPPDVEAADAFLREGVGRVLGLYILLRTDDRRYRFSADEYETLEGAMHEWLSLYAAAYGLDARPDPPLRSAAELLLDTDDLWATARSLTGIPDERS